MNNKDRTIKIMLGTIIVLLIALLMALTFQMPTPTPPAAQNPQHQLNIDDNTKINPSNNEYKNVDYKDGKITVFGTVLCGEKCKNILEALKKSGIQVDFIESNYLIDIPISQAANQILPYIAGAFHSDNIGYPFLVYWYKDKIVLFAQGIQDPQQILDLYKQTYKNEQAEIYTGNGFVLAPQDLINRVKEWYAQNKDKIGTWDDYAKQASWATSKSIVVKKQTCPPQNGFLILGASYCPYTRAMVHYSEKAGYDICFLDGDKHQEIWQALQKIQKLAFGSEQGIPTVIGFKDGKIVSIFVGFVGKDNLPKYLEGEPRVYISYNDTKELTASTTKAIMDTLKPVFKFAKDNELSSQTGTSTK